MKKTPLLISSILLFWGGCQSLQTTRNPTFAEFQIRKMSSVGIETVTVNSSSLEWPEIQQLKAAPVLLDSKNLRLAVIGDTGCRLKESRGKATYQNCSVTKEWPYPEVTKSLASEAYDFVIHTGDYHYREQCTDAKLCSAYAQRTGYGWAAWWDDFFAPSVVLFKKSPWLFVRGNHEDCQRAYAGWNVLSPAGKRLRKECEEIEKYQWIEMDDLVFINFDNSSFEDRKDIQTADLEKWKPQLVEIAERIKGLEKKKEIWFLTHKPILGFFPDPADAEPVPIKPYLESLLKEVGLYQYVDFFLSGHIHNQQILPKDSKIQLIVGNGGSSLDPFGRKIKTDQLVTSTENKYSFGYALLHRTGFKKWNFIFKDQYGAEQMQCHVEKNKIDCD